MDSFINMPSCCRYAWFFMHCSVVSASSSQSVSDSVIFISDSGDLYIDFVRNHLIFPVACLVCQVTAMFIFFLPEHAYASHIISCISFMFCIMLLVHFPCLIMVPLLVFLSWVEPGDEFVNEEPVEYAYGDQAFDNSENLAGKMTIPSKSLLSLLC